MVFFTLFSFLLLLFNSGSFKKYFISFIPLSLFLFYSNSFYNSPSSMAFLSTDEISLFLIFMLLLVMFFSLFFSFHFLNRSFVTLMAFSMLVLCSLVFCTGNLLVLYISYEISLIPIILIICIWGAYPERSLSSMLLLLYTSIFTMPFMYLLWYIYTLGGSFVFIALNYSFNLNSFSFPIYFMVLTFLVFAVKLPVYGLHFWLPMAHVEAPTFGSMILAGVLLKLGGVGLLRCSFMLNGFSPMVYFSLSFFLIFLLYATLVCSLQGDFKRLIAYSSVSHMMVLPILLFILTPLSLKGFTLAMVFHGLSSPLLFSMVGFVYSMCSTRQLLLIRGIMAYSPLFMLIGVLAFTFTCCIPPFPSFVAEAFFFISSLLMSSYMWIILIVFSFISLVYNLNWLSSIFFVSSGNSVSYSNSFVTFNFFFSSFMFIVTSFVFVSFFLMV